MARQAREERVEFGQLLLQELVKNPSAEISEDDIHSLILALFPDIPPGSVPGLKSRAAQSVVAVGQGRWRLGDVSGFLQKTYRPTHQQQQPVTGPQQADAKIIQVVLDSETARFLAAVANKQDKKIGVIAAMIIKGYVDERTAAAKKEIDKEIELLRAKKLAEALDNIDL